jgi:hypothetical protein
LGIDPKLAPAIILPDVMRYLARAFGGSIIPENIRSFSAKNIVEVRELFRKCGFPVPMR